MSPRKIAEYSKSFTATGVDSHVIDMSTGPMAHFALQAKASGFTAWSVKLEGSIDGTNYDTVLTHDNSSPGDGKLVWTTTAKPIKKARLNFATSTGSGTLDVTMLGVPT